ncbi:hypothetical protein BCIN_04g03920 [Botrytis cinerea B05.10]|uniref:DUF7888 domain-containing protein n=3 Tax=Botryotinia fuckeliana TaxID=40559 RepID=A0A384JF26_BOTFB|nr:hypothetical protein BCIN_04g03920 [Botrytis cinerea B05.10]ATZ49215.1 hypothetical protein BCIN_04g03920 [Botrytis cinerea B05.10]EMR90042.1 hypothetical protein BcDW1_1309 [Botrytis cinerea BcDW1]CCD49861.1 hypothetical protein BofuT4_P095690.1 [Botrytis cinerea T4]
MKFSIITLIACAAIAQGAALPQAAATTSADAPISTAPNSVIADSTETHFSGVFDASGSLVAKVDDEPTQELQKRVGAVAVVLGIAAVKGVAILTKIAVEIGSQTIANLGKWNDARETFTQTTTKEMWARNPDYNKYPAVVCYNKGYSLKNAAGVTGKVSAKLSLGMLNTDYDCMYMTGNNQFYTHSEGGYINLSYRYNNRCSFDQKSGDLSCN